MGLVREMFVFKVARCSYSPVSRLVAFEASMLHLIPRKTGLLQRLASFLWSKKVSDLSILSSHASPIFSVMPIGA